jgi:2-polyprenyl-3-methyl-5-hydroxy-6-metoxy-1,4-benzoquinol methylase
LGERHSYPPEAVERVRLIQRALAVGFSLSELSEILKIRDGGGSPCRKVTGYFSVRLAKSAAGPKVHAADIEPSMVSYLRERATKEGLDNVTAVQAAADQPNLPEPVDLVLIVDTYHHIADRETYFRKLAKSISGAA